MFVKFPRGYDSGSVFYKAGEVRDLDKRTADLLVAQGVAVYATSTPMDDYTNGLASVLAQSAVPVMIAQSGYTTAAGLLIPGNFTTSSLTLSATSGSVTVTLGTALLAGTSADNGKQITFFDGGTWRSILVTAFSSTTSCTGTLSSTASSTSIGTTQCQVGNPLPTNYTGGIWVYLPAGAISGGAAGFYWCVATQTATANGVLQVTTAFQAAMGVPFIPAGFSNAVGSGSNFTGVTTLQALASVTVPGGAMGANGSIRVPQRVSASNSANQKVLINFFSGVNVAQNNISTTNTFVGASWVENRGLTNAQIAQGTNTGQSFAAMGGATTVVPFTYHAIDTSVNQPLAVSGQLLNATDFIVLEGFTVEVLPRA